MSSNNLTPKERKFITGCVNLIAAVMLATAAVLVLSTLHDFSWQDFIAGMFVWAWLGVFLSHFTAP